MWIQETFVCAACHVVCCYSSLSSRCENSHESEVAAACKGLDFTWKSTSIWNRAIYTIHCSVLDFTYICNSHSFYPPRRPWHYPQCRFHTTCDKSFSDFTQILFRSIFQLHNSLTLCFLLQFHIFATNRAGQFLTGWAIQSVSSLS